MVSVTSANIREALQARYSGAEWTLAWEVSDSSGFNGKRWADCVAFNLWPSRGHVTYGIEIKVSRADWQRELAQPAKAEAIHQYCNEWWVAAAQKVVVTAELPHGWGLLEYQETGRLAGKLAVVRPATPQFRGDLPRDFVAAYLKAIHRRDDAEINAKLKELVDKRVADAEKFWNERHRERRDAAAEKLLKIEAALQRHNVLTWDHNSDQLAEAVALLLKGRFLGHYSRVTTLLKQLDDSERDMRSMRETLGEALGVVFPVEKDSAA